MKVSGTEGKSDHINLKSRTIKNLQANTKMLNYLNRNHKDNIFKTPKNTGPSKKKQGSTKNPKGILAELFYSDSEDELDMHSPKTPIRQYFEQSETETPELNRLEHNKGRFIISSDIVNDSPAIKCDKDQYKLDAFINRKIKELHQIRKNPSSSRSASIVQSHVTQKCPRNKTEHQAYELVKPISCLLNLYENAQEVEDEEETESYFSEEEQCSCGEFVNETCITMLSKGQRRGDHHTRQEAINVNNIAQNEVPFARAPKVTTSVWLKDNNALKGETRPILKKAQRKAKEAIELNKLELPNPTQDKHKVNVLEGAVFLLEDVQEIKAQLKRQKREHKRSSIKDSTLLEKESELLAKWFHAVEHLENRKLRCNRSSRKE